MPKEATCLLFADPSDLPVLRSEGMLPEDFLGVFDRSLEDTAQIEFEDLLRAHSVVAFPRQLLSEDAGLDEALPARAAKRYRDNLRQYLVGQQSVRLMILHHPPREDSTGDSLDGLTRELRTLQRIWEGSQEHASLTYIMVATQPLTANDRERLDRIRKCAMVNRVYLMTHQLNPVPGLLIHAEYIWPLAVSRLLCRLIARPPSTDARQADSAPLLAWRSVDFGPTVNVRAAEEIRLRWTRAAMGLDTESATDFQESVRRMAALLQLHADVKESASKTSEARVDPANEEDTMGVWRGGCREPAVRLATSMLGRERWKQTSSTLEAAWRTAVGEAAITSGRDEPSEALERAFTEVHAKPESLAAIINVTVPPPDPTDALKRRQEVAGLQALRTSSYAAERECLLASAEWDAANSRLVPWQDRLLAGLVPVVLLTLQGSLLVAAVGVRGLALWGAVLGVAVLATAGAATAAVWSWKIELRKLNAAAAVLRRQVREAETRGIALRSRPIEIAEQSATAQAVRAGRSVSALAVAIASRTRQILRAALLRGALNADEIPPSLVQRIPLAEHALALQDRREYQAALRASDGNTHALDESHDKSLPEGMRIKTDFLARWKEWSQRADPDCRGHYPYSQIFPEVERWVLRVRDEIWSLAVEQAVHAMENRQGDLSEEFKRTCGLLQEQSSGFGRPHLSCRITQNEAKQKSADNMHDRTERFTFVYRGPIGEVSDAPIVELTRRVIQETRKLFENFVSPQATPLPSPKLPVPGMLFEELPVQIDVSPEGEICVLIGGGE